MDDELQQRYENWLEDLAALVDRHVPTGVTRIDAHTHLGVDAGSGLEMTVDALEEQLRLARVAQAVVIPLNASDGYHRDSLRLIERASEIGDRFHALYRLDPRDDELRAHAREGLDAGAVGFKLHPASDEFDPRDPGLVPALELAAERHALVLVHTGVDVDHAAPATLDLAERYPDARFVLGHVPVEALHSVSERLRDLPNVWTCLSWWGPHDVSVAMQWVPAGRVVHGSDPPYGHALTGMAQTVLVARALGLGDDRLASLVGGSAQRLLDPSMASPDAQAPDEVSIVPRDLLAELPIALRRCYLALLSAVGVDWQGADPTQYLRFADQALEPGLVPGELTEVVDTIRGDIDLACALHGADATAQAYAVGIAALTHTLTAPVLASG